MMRGTRIAAWLAANGLGAAAVVAWRWSLGGGRLAGEDFASSMIRQVLLAVRRLPKARKRPAGRNWLRTEWADDWKNRERLTAILLEQRLSETLI